MKEATHRRPNLYQMFLEHGGPGFWIRRVTWTHVCGRVVRVGAFRGEAPYFGNPVVLADLYKLEGGIKDVMVPLSSPGGSTWERIERPDWAAKSYMEPLSFRLYDEALSHWERKQAWDRHQRAIVEKVWLEVPFEQKAEARAIGAHWSPEDRKWWLPAMNEAAIENARAKGFID